MEESPPTSLPQLILTVAYDLAEQRRLYSYCEPSVDCEELLSIFGEKKDLVLWVDQNTWVVYITVVLLGTLVLEKWEVNFTCDWLPQLEGVGPYNLLQVLN